MTRSPRIVIPGRPHHVVQRGNRRVDVFLDDEDREVFLRMLDNASCKHGLKNIGYTLMTNHEHQISIPEEESSLALAMKDTYGSYATYFNHRYGLSGRLWQGRFYSVPLDESHFGSALRYVERNPVRAGIVKRAEDYRWSSAAAHCGLCEDPFLAPLSRSPAGLGNWSDWLIIPESPPDLLEIRKSTRLGRPSGPDSLLEEFERLTGRKLVPRITGRPRKKPIR